MVSLGWALIHYDGCLIKKGNLDKHAPREKAMNNVGRNHSDASTSQGTAKITSKPPKARNEPQGLPHSSQREPSLLTLGSQTSSHYNKR